MKLKGAILMNKRFDEGYKPMASKKSESSNQTAQKAAKRGKIGIIQRSR